MLRGKRGRSRHHPIATSNPGLSEPHQPKVFFWKYEYAFVCGDRERERETDAISFPHACQDLFTTREFPLDGTEGAS